jgi:hypothetical protein
MVQHFRLHRELSSTFSLLAFQNSKGMVEFAIPFITSFPQSRFEQQVELSSEPSF